MEAEAGVTALEEMVAEEEWEDLRLSEVDLYAVLKVMLLVSVHPPEWHPHGFHSLEIFTSPHSVPCSWRAPQRGRACEGVQVEYEQPSISKCYR